jgi:hypothetical protein
MNHTPELTPQELEKMEKLLEAIQPDISPSAEFTLRMQKRLERHYTLMQARDGAEATPASRRGFFSFMGTRVYSAITAFAFVLFTGGLSTFAYTSNTITNGSPLYPIKRGLEKIESTFVSTPGAMAEYQMRLLARRLDESRFLTSQGIVDDSTNQDVSTVVDNGIVAIQNVEHSDYRDQLLDRFTTLLLAQESKFYTDAGITPPVAIPVVAPVASSDLNISAPALMSTEVAPATLSIAPMQAPVESHDSQKSSGVEAKWLAEPSDTQIDIRASNTTISAPQVETDSRISEKKSSSKKSASRDEKDSDSSAHDDDNITVPLSVKPGVLNAIEKNRKHLKEVENKIKEARRSR